MGEVLPVAGGCGKGESVGVELLRCAIGERRMRSRPVVIVAPRGEQAAGLRERREQRLVQALGIMEEVHH